MNTRKQLNTGSPNNLASVKSLLAVFISWKVLLLCVACISPGPGYDTSTQLLLPAPSGNDTLPVRLLLHITSRLVRWDALYYIRIAQRDYLFEQEWAFSWGFTRVVSLVAKVLPISDLLLKQALAGTLVAHLFHLLTVLILFALTLQILPPGHLQKTKIAFIAATLHVVSPAGLFLSAPYAESLFSCLNFLGMLLYSYSYSRRSGEEPSASNLAAIMASGLCWGLASTARGNGILSGITLAYRCLLLLKSLPKFSVILEIAVTILAGILVALGTVLPQWIAYQEYCLDAAIDQSPIWCSRIPPSVFTWVQAHYWNVGFLRYWTLSNVPLFLLAIPIICLMLLTASIAILHPGSLLQSSPSQAQQATPKTKEHNSSTNNQRLFVTCMRSFALPQAVLALLTLTNFHVQIINRISSGYPIWYVVLAMMFTSRNEENMEGRSPVGLYGKVLARLRKPGTQRWVFSSMILYAIVQGGLYASFMPPA